MSAFLLDSDGDFDLTRGQLTVTSNLAQCTIQKLNVRFQFYLGAWFLDTREGVPALQQIYIKNPNLGLVNQLVARIIQQTPGIAAVQTVGATFTSTYRALQSTAQATLSDDTIILGGPGNPFIVTPNGKGQA